MALDKKEVVVHTGEALSVTYNPATHETTSAETPDGNVILSIRPSGDGEDVTS